MLAFSSKNIDAKTAKYINLVSDVFDNKEQLISEVLKIVQSFTKNPKSALFATKKFINSLIEEAINTQLDKIAQFNAKFLNIHDIQNNLPKIFKKEQ
jgi:enoyl-CoA hydratase